MEELVQLAKAARWKELEQRWLQTVESNPDGGSHESLLEPIDVCVKSKQSELAETLGWAWLSAAKTKLTPEQALRIARELLLRLPSGEELRSEVLTLYRQTHADAAHLDEWIERSGLAGGKSVKRALRFLDVGLMLAPGACLLHRGDDDAGELVEADLASDTFVVRTARRRLTLTAERIVDDYDVADADDFRVLQSLRPERIAELAESDPETLLIGIARGHRNRVDRDELKYILVPRHVPADQWSNWWSRARDTIKKSKHLRIEGRSPMMILYEPRGMTLEDETWAAFEKADSPRAWLEVVEGYLRQTRGKSEARQHAFLERIQTTLVVHARKFAKHEPTRAFATALVIERLAEEGLPIHPEAHGVALDMLRQSRQPARLVLDLPPDAAVWELALPAVRQALPDGWVEVFAALMRLAPLSQLDALGKAVEDAGRADLLQPIIDEAVADPVRHVDVFMWIWRGPGVKAALSAPPRLELLSKILALVGTARQRTGQAERGADVNALRAKVRAGLSARNYAAYRALLEQIDLSMATAFRRQIERADGLGPVVQDEMMSILREHFPSLYAKVKVAPWDEEGVLYVTREGMKVRQAELDELVNVKMKENARAIGAAAELGDLSENSEYKFALEERDLLRARVAQIQSELSMARIIEAEEIPDDHVGIGQRVTLRADDGDETLVMTLLGPWESDLTRHIYSYQTPLARRLLGRKPGEVIDLSLEGVERRWRIESLEPAVSSMSVRAV